MRTFIALSTFLISAFLLSGCDSAEDRIDSHHKRGLELVEQGELVKARLEFRNALQIDANHVPALFSLGQLEQRTGNVQQAFGLFRHVANAAPKHLGARVGLANIFFVAGQIEDAIKFTNEAYELDPKDNRVLLLKGSIALKLEKPDEAVEFAVAVLKTEPHNLNALMLRAAERISVQDAQGALTFLNRGEEKSARNIILQLFRLRTLNALKDRDGVENVLKKLIGFYPENSTLRYSLAQWYQAVDRKNDAEQVLRQFATDFPKSTQAGGTLVTYLAREKGFEAAKSELLKRIEASDGRFGYQIMLAQLTFSEGNYEDAYSILSDAMSEKGSTPEGAQAKVLLARMKAERNELTEAEALTNAVLAEDTKNADALGVRSYIRIANKQYADAIEDLLAALNEEPESIRILQLLAQAYELNGSAGLAEEQLSRALTLDKFKPRVGLGYVQFLLRYGKAKQAERVLTQIRSVAPSNKQVLTLLGRVKLARKDWLGAQETADALRKLDDTEAVADRILAEVLSGQQKFEESNEILKASLSDATSGAAPLARYVENLIRGNKAPQAVDFLTEILAKDPDNLRARVLLGSVHEVTGQFELAESTLKTAAEKDLDGVSGYDALARFYIRRARLKVAEETIRTALARKDDNRSLHLLLANVLERTGQYEAAITEYEVLFEASPQSTIIANNLASLLADYGSKPEHIERAYSIALRFRGSDIPYFLDTLGWIHFLRDDYEQAVTLLKTASEQLQNVALVQFHLGMTYKALAQNALAIERLERAIELSKGQQFSQLEKAQTALAQLKAEAASQN